MRRSTYVDIGVLPSAALLFAYGLVSKVRPREAAWAQPATDPASTTPGSYVEVLSKKGTPLYGVLGTVLGVGLAILALYPKAK